MIRADGVALDRHITTRLEIQYTSWKLKNNCLEISCNVLNNSRIVQVYGPYSGDMEAAGQNMDYSEDSGAPAPLVSRDMLAPIKESYTPFFPRQNFQKRGFRVRVRPWARNLWNSMF